MALKVLPASFASDPERLGRFDREGRALAAFSHPSIAGIYGLEDTGGQRFLVMWRTRRGPPTATSGPGT